MARIKKTNKREDNESEQPLHANNTRLPIEWIATLKKLAEQKSKDAHPDYVSMSDLIRLAIFEKWIKQSEVTE